MNLRVRFAVRTLGGSPGPSSRPGWMTLVRFHESVVTSDTYRCLPR